MIKVILLITGGAIGTVCRYGLSVSVQRTVLNSFPLGILSVNVTGSFLIGLCWSIAEACNMSLNARLFLFTGIFGGFTTFSSFALDTFALLKMGDYKMAVLNILANNVLGLLAVAMGWFLGKNLMTLIK